MINLGGPSTPGRLYEEISSHRFDKAGRCACGVHLPALNPVEQARHLTEAILAAGFIHESDANEPSEGEAFLAQYLAEIGEPIRIGRGTHLGGARITICCTEGPAGFTAELTMPGGEAAAQPWERVGDGCTCWVNPKPFTHYGAVEPGDALEPDPDCPEHFPASSYCSRCDHDEHVCGGCGEPIAHGSYTCAGCRGEVVK